MEEHDHNVSDETYVHERLVDVSSETPCLKMRQDLQRSGYSSNLEYAALSYCWGSGEGQVTTTAATLCDRQEGISDTEMPQVLRDAIRVTRDLGIPFLWIDSLCILQDNHSDWEEQCTEMHNSYGSARVTLCATNSRSCNDGFLQHKSPCARLPFQSSRSPNMASSFLVRHIAHLSDRSDPPFGSSDESWVLRSTDVDNSLWNQRGWVFQENQLSTRKLIFGRCSVYFSCVHVEHARGKCATMQDYLESPTGNVLAENDSKVIYAAWDQCILYCYSEYDASSFSRAEDVLPGLSGLARILGRRLKDVYYAGHWRQDLYRSLSWISSSTGSHPLRPATLIIPSWSRLAKGDTEAYAYDWSDTWIDLRSEINVPKARATTVGDNPFGALKECCLWIRGYTLDMSRTEVHFSAEPRLTIGLGHWHLVLHGRCFGHLAFDWQAGHDDPSMTCPSAEDVRELKLLLLGSFKYSTSGGLIEDEESEGSSIPRNQDLAPENNSAGESESQEHSEELEGFEWSSSHEQMSDEETSILDDDDSEDRQSEMTIRR